MRSSLPEIFRKNSLELTKPQKQSPQYSLFIRTNNFQFNININPSQNRYSKSTTNKINNSMNLPLKDKDNLSYLNHSNQTQRRSILTARKKNHSKSFFIQESQDFNAEEIDSFSSIRKRVLEDLNVIKKSMDVVDKIQKSIRGDLQKFKQTELQNLNSFQMGIKDSIQYLKVTLKKMRKQTHTEIKVNREQVNFLQQEINNFKQIYEGFQKQENSCRIDIVNPSIITQ